MDCIKCNSSQVRVIDTRAKGTRRIYRRRVCMMCGFRWTTVELPVGDVRQAVDAVNGLEERRGKKHKTQVLGGEVSPKQIDAVQEEALDVVLAALNGEAGMSGPDIPFLCAALHFWRDELIERMRREHPDDLEAEKAAYIMMKRHYKGEAKKVGGDE